MDRAIACAVTCYAMARLSGMRTVFSYVNNCLKKRDLKPLVGNILSVLIRKSSPIL